MKPKNERGRVYENKLAKEGRATKQPLSGAGWADKEDLFTKHELIQAKSTASKLTYTLHRGDMRDVVRHAAALKKVGVLFLEWDTEEYVVLRRKDYENHVTFEEVLCIVCKEEEPVVCRECLGKRIAVAEVQS